jgi:hypothetical protein
MTKCAECGREYVPGTGTGEDMYCPVCNWQSYGPCGFCEQGEYIGPRNGCFGVCNYCGAV